MTFEPVTRQVRAAVGRYGTRVALHEVRDGVTHLTTYSQLGRRATQHVAALRDVFADLDTAAGASRAAGARGPQDSRYVVVAGDGPDALIAELAVLAIGAISVPVATLDGATLAELRAEGIDPSAGFAAAPAGDVDIVCLPIAPTIWFADTPGRPELPPDAPAILLREGGRHTILTHGQLAAGVESLRELLPLEPGQRQAVYLPDSPAAARGFAWHALTQGAQICHVSDAAQIPALRARVVAVDVDHVPSPADLDRAGDEDADSPSAAGSWPQSDASIDLGSGSSTERADLPAPPDRPGLRSRLARTLDVRGPARRFGWRVERDRARGEKQSWLVRTTNGVLEATILAKDRGALGHPQVVLACGDHALPDEVSDVYFGAGRAVYQAWTTPEAVGPLTANVPARIRFGTLGTARPGVTLVQEALVREADAPAAQGETTNAPVVRARAPWMPGTASLAGHIDADGYVVPSPTPTGHRSPGATGTPDRRESVHPHG